jgi:hypothetical protein
MGPWLVLGSAVVVVVLATVHLIYAFASNKFEPRDPALKQQMQAAPLRISSQTTMWRAALGFHASHSLGALLFALIYGGLALTQWPLLRATPFLIAVGALYLAAMLVLARRYWFHIPFIGFALSLALYGVGIFAPL